MTISANNGWDFVKQGMFFQYKEERYNAVVKIVENKSTDKEYDFLIKVVAANMKMSGTFSVNSRKQHGKSEFFENTPFSDDHYPHVFEPELFAEYKSQKGV